MSHAADSPVDKAAKPPASQPIELRKLALAVAACFGLLLWLTAAIQTFLIVPPLEKQFLDFKTKLPWLTEQVLMFSRFSWLLLPMCLIAAVLVCIAVSWRSRSAGVILFVALPLVINLLVIASIYFPYVELLDGLSGGPKK